MSGHYSRSTFKKAIESSGGWTTIKTKRSHKKPNQLKKIEPETTETKPTMHELILQNSGSEFYKTLQTHPEILDNDVRPDEYEKELEEFCEQYSLDKENKKRKTDWYIMSEAYNVVLDKKRMKKNLEPIYSETLGGSLFIIEPTPSKPKVEKPTNVKLPQPIVLVREWNEGGAGGDDWRSEVMARMTTSNDLIDVLTRLEHSQKTSTPFFAVPLKGKEVEADDIFNSLLRSGKSDDDTVEVDAKDQNRVRKMVGNFNSIHYSYAFIVDRGSDKVPFIRGARGTTNSIDINAKETKNLKERGKILLDTKLQNGLLMELIFAFAGGNIPGMEAIVFCRTIAVRRIRNRFLHFRGFRIRPLGRTGEFKLMQELERAIQKILHKWKDCVVNVISPKR